MGRAKQQAALERDREYKEEKTRRTQREYLEVSLGSSTVIFVTHPRLA